jgi:putative endonuclease
MDRHFVYILRSERDPLRHYVGLTSDVAKRLEWHNAGQNVHTARNRPWRVVVSLEFDNQLTAARFERYLKSGSGRAFAKRHFGNEPCTTLSRGTVIRRDQSIGEADSR